MRETNVAIIGFDEQKCRDLTAMVRKAMGSDWRIVMSAVGPHRLLPLMESGAHVDVLYMDMGDDETPSMALDVVRSVQRLCPWVQVVLFSSYPAHAMSAYAIPHSFFLLCPFREDFVSRSVEEVAKGLELSIDRPFGLKIGSSMAKIRPSQILYAESNRHKILVHARGGKEFEAYLRLSQLAEFLPSSFVQIHKSFLVNMDHVVNLDVNGVEMSDGAVIPVSQSRRKEVRDAFAQSCSFVKGSCA